MKKFLPLSLLSGVLLGLGWPATGNLSPLLLLAFIPLLFIEDKISSNGYSMKKGGGASPFGYVYLSFLVWNAWTSWWIYCVSESMFTKVFISVGTIAANAFLMSLPFTAYHLTKKYVGRKEGYISLIFYWLAFEYFHFNWEGNWVWLTLGNGFANYPGIIQWYEYTGVLGGSLWILIVNILLYECIRKSGSGLLQPINIRKTFLNALPALLFIFIPVVLSLFIYYQYREITKPVKVAIVQPNIDPYRKFDVIAPSDQLMQMLKLSSAVTDSSTGYLVAPETALTENIWENDFNKSRSISEIRSFLKQFPKLKFVTGASTYRMFEPGEAISETARKFTDSEERYDAFNTALQMDSSMVIQIFHKSKLVPFVEKMPYSSIFKPLESLALDMGGTTGSLGIQTSREPFFSPDKTISAVPAICYESLFGEYLGEYLRNGGELIFIITNDGWWDETPGYKQHFAYARICAIEHRRSVAQSANTGISGFINQRGDVLQRTGWWEPAAIKGMLNANSQKTIYALWGDYIGRVASFVAVLLLILTVTKKILARKQ